MFNPLTDFYRKENVFLYVALNNLTDYKIIKFRSLVIFVTGPPVKENPSK